MARFVSFKTPPVPKGDSPGPPFVVVNPDHVVLFEPLANQTPPACRLWLALPLDIDGSAPFRDVLGTLKDVGQRLMDPPAPSGDPLGTHRP